MSPLSVQIKHAGKIHPVQLDPDLPTTAFKEAVYQVTGVPVNRMKIMVKGGVLKDNSSWASLAPKEGQTFMVIGAAGELPKPPAKPIVFLEDMDDAELAETLARPVGLRNLGNTCYMNASVQALRAIPELQIALSAPSLQSSTPLPAALRDLYVNMSRTTDSITPMAFLQVLREVNPQFAERDRGAKVPGMMAGFAQQDAEECFGQIINTLRNVPGLPDPNDTAANKFIDQYLMGEMRRELKCDEAPEEPPSITHEKVLKLECNINITTNFMLTGIMNSLDQKIEKNSPTLGREAVYTQSTRMTRLPGYLVVHMVRFAWRQDIMKKAKIMRKVKFPLEFDALDLATPELKAQLLPVSRRLGEIEKERAERRKIRKRSKGSAPSGTLPATSSSAVATTTSTTGDVDMADAPSGDVTTEGAGKEKVAGGELEPENTYREREANELKALVADTVKRDKGCSESGLYDLVAIVTHKGAAADAGHYMGFVKKSVFHASKTVSPLTSAPDVSMEGEGASKSIGNSVGLDEDDEDWYKFDDDKVTVFPKEKLATLDGGGEDSSAYVLVYRSKPLA